MFRILIVEDDPFSSSQMKALLDEALREPGDRAPHKIDTALNIQTARRLIESAVATKRPYDAIVLDLVLPSQSGQIAEFDESLCMTAHTLMPYALVAHITAYDKDDQIRTHVQRCHTEVIDKSFVLSKRAHFAQELSGRLKAFLFGQQLEERMDDVFGPFQAGEQGVSRIPRRPESVASLTHELAALCREVATHWHDLDERTQTRVRAIFYVDDTTETIRVSLLSQ